MFSVVRNVCLCGGRQEEENVVINVVSHHCVFGYVV